MMHFLLVSVALLAVSTPWALSDAHSIKKRHSFGFGDCPLVDPMENFEWNKFQGEWYVIEKLATRSRCYTYNYTEDEGQKKVVQQMEHFLPSILNIKHTFTAIGLLDVPNKNVMANMTVRFKAFLNNPGQYVVLMTDYEKYAAVYTCQELFFFHMKSISILSRKPELEKIYKNKVYQRLENMGINTSKFDTIKHENCIEPSKATFNLNIN